MDYFIGSLKKYADFTGRARRKEYWMFILVYFILSLVVGVLDAMVGMGFLAIIFTLGMIIPSFSIAARRLHDTGRSGWWQLILLIPLIGFIVFIIFTVQDSHDANDYGPNPKVGELA